MTTVLTEQQNETVLNNVPLVEHIVNRIGANLPAVHQRDDLVQAGIMGLISATIRFDPGAGTAFSTFAGRRIEGAIIDMLRQADWAPRSVRSLERRLSAAARPEQTTEANRTMVRLSKELGLAPEELLRLRADIDKARIDSLDRQIGGEGVTVPLSATLFDNDVDVEGQIDDQEMIAYVRDGVALLPERHRIVVVGFYFEGRSMTELGAFLGVSQSRASQIKDEALKLLRSGLDSVYATTDDDAETDVDAEPSSRQLAFNESLATARPWRDRVTAGKGISVVG